MRFRGARRTRAAGDRDAACPGDTATVVAAADSDLPSVTEFTAPNRAAIDKLQNLGYDPTEYTRPADGGGLVIDGIIGYDVEIGVDHILTTPQCAATGAPIPMSDRNSCVQQVGFQPCCGPVGTGGTAGSCPADGSLVNEGHDEAMEFANGNIGLPTAASAHELDHSPPDVKAVFAPTDAGLDLTFTQSEPADIYYTLDGSTPTTASSHWQPEGPRRRVQPVHLPVPGPVTVKFFAVDVKGQTSAVQTANYRTQAAGTVGGSVPATLALTVGAPAGFGASRRASARRTRRRRRPA